LVIILFQKVKSVENDCGKERYDKLRKAKSEGSNALYGVEPVQLTCFNNIASTIPRIFIIAQTEGLK